MEIKATFTGQDGSKGYKTGSQYKLEVTHKKGNDIHVRPIASMDVHVYSCNYESMVAFLNNWDNITIVK